MDFHGIKAIKKDNFDKETNFGHELTITLYQ